MNETPQVLLAHHLKALKLPTDLPPQNRSMLSERIFGTLSV